MVTWICAFKKGATILLWSLPWEAVGCMVALLVERELKLPVLG
jgi:cytochrome c-type biogenesis protein CcmH/NrfF